MRDPRITLKNPWVAGILAFLLPGAGHLYQGRLFKAALNFLCILGLFLTGMAMAEWQAVQTPPEGAFRNRNWTALLKYGAQAAVGAPAWYGMVQRERYFSADNHEVSEIRTPFSAPFQGEVSYRGVQESHSGEITGTIHFEPAREQFGRASITGQLEGVLNGKPVTLQLSDHVQLARPVDSRKARAVTTGIVSGQEGQEETVGRLTGSIPRAFSNWFQVPMDDHEQQELHRRLGKYHELAMVFTWIAGLLNVLAIWDAVEGPAYGYGDEDESEAAADPPAT